MCHYVSKMKDVRSKYPAHEITWAIKCDRPFEIREFIKHNPYIDRIEILPERDLGFGMSPRFKDKIKSITDKGGEFLDFLLPNYGDTLKFISQEDWHPDLSDRDLAFAEDFQKKYIGTSGLISIHPASTLRKGPQWFWPVRNYKRLCELILRNLSHTILVVGELSPPVRHERIIDLTNNYYLGITLREIIALILKSDIVIGGDSGFEILPWFCGNSVIGLVPQRHMSEGMYKDFARKGLGKSVRVTADVWLPGSYPKGNRNVVLPFERTTPEEVYRQIEHLLGEKSMLSGDRTAEGLTVYRRKRYRSWLRVLFHTIVSQRLRRRHALRSDLSDFIKHYLR
jgi:hypothetical protein